MARAEVCVMLHTHTPNIIAADPRGLVVRTVAYQRRSAEEAARRCVTQQRYDAAGRLVQSRDPRQFQRLEEGQPGIANQTTVFSLSGAALLSDNSDAGWRLNLSGAAGQALHGWDQKHSHTRQTYDNQLRAQAVFVQADADAPHCIARLSYADASAEHAAHNRCGRLIRHDDTGGAQFFAEFSLSGAPLEHGRRFLAQPQWAVDWPATEAERDAHLEPELAASHFAYNGAAELIAQTDALGNRQRLRHTRAGELHEAHLNLQGSTQEQLVLSEVRYNAFGQIEQQRAGNGVLSSATFRPEDGRLVHLKTQANNKAPSQDLTYTYDPVGNVVSITDAAQAVRYSRNQRIAAISTFRYDSLYRLIEATGRQIRNAPGGPQAPAFQSPPDPSQLENYTQAYYYDAAGNLELLQHSAASGNRSERTAIAADNNRSLPYTDPGQAPGDGEIRDGYDDNGNLKILQPGQHLAWDAQNRLQQVDQVVREDGPNDRELYLYDSNGQRLQKIREAYTAKLTRTHETRYLPGLEIRTGPTQTLHLITLHAGRCTLQVLHWQQGRPADIPQDQMRYGFTDHLGSSTLELDANAALISQESYYPYGATCWWAGRNQAEASYKTRRYSGQERDATGLYYYGQRYYAPWRQRWLNADPSGTADGLNLFAMVHGNPVRFVDMQGLGALEALRAFAWTFGRESVSAIASAVVRYGSTLVITALHSAVGNPLGFTVAGVVVGGAIGMATGMAAANNWAHGSRHRMALLAAGAATGLALNAGPSVLGHFIPVLDVAGAAINVPAIFTLATPLANLARESVSQAVNHIGQTNPWVGVPPAAAFSYSLAASGATAGSVGALTSLMLSNDPYDPLTIVEGTLGAGIATGSGVGASAAARTGNASAPTKPAKGGSMTVDAEKLIVNTVMRSAFSLPVQLVTHPLAVTEVLGPALGLATRGVSRASTSVIAGLRLAVKPAIEQGVENFLNPGANEAATPIQEIELSEIQTLSRRLQVPLGGHERLV